MVGGVKMNKKEVDVCCKYGFSVGLLIDNIECMFEDIADGEEIEEEMISYVKTRIEKVREHEKEFKEILDIKASEVKY